MSFQIVVTHLPSSRFGVEEPEELAEPRLFKGFRARTGRRDASLYGGRPEVVLYDEFRHEAPGTWVTRDAAESNWTRLAERGYVAHLREVQS